MDKINEIVETAHRIYKSLNLFERYMPKKTEGKTQEALFWRDVVNMYGLFCDCDRIQIKEKENLFSLFKKYSLINKMQYQSVREFYDIISALRAWFCHNYDQERYYSHKTEIMLQQFLKETSVLEGVSQNPEEIDWVSADAHIRNRFEEYLDILAEALKKIEVSSSREEIKKEWCELYAKALFHDRELLNNVLAENYEYYCRDLCIPLRRLGENIKKMRQRLEENGYSYEDILKSIWEYEDQTVAASELVRDSIRKYDFEF